MTKFKFILTHLIYKSLKFLNYYAGTIYLLKQYLYVIDKIFPPPIAKNDTDTSDYVWTMWWQGEVPELVNVCISSIKQFYPDTIVITENNLKDYIEIPDYIIEKMKKGQICMALFSDIVRICLLEKYGGTWIDSTCYLTNKIPNYITNSDIFLFETKRCEYFGYINYFYDLISNFFIYAKKNNYIIKVLKAFLLEYWKYENKSAHYFMFHKFCELAKKYNSNFKEEWDKIPISCGINTKTMAHVLKKPFDKDIYDYLHNTSFLHKLTYKNFDSEKIPKDSLYFYLKEQVTSKGFQISSDKNQVSRKEISH